MFYSDSINIAVSVDGELAMTFYKIIPDPAIFEHKVGVQRALAIAQMPIGVATQLPGLIADHLLKRAELSSEGLERAVVRLRALADEMESKLKNGKEGQDAASH